MKKRILFSVSVLIFFFTLQLHAQETPIHQLRIYEIYKDNKEAFHERFSDHAMRIMKKYDFSIVAIWESQHDDKVEFIYVLEWKTESAMSEAWTKFKADTEWVEIKNKTSEKHGQLVGEIEDRVMKVQAYSPKKSLLK